MNITAGSNSSRNGKAKKLRKLRAQVAKLEQKKAMDRELKALQSKLKTLRK